MAQSGTISWHALRPFNGSQPDAFEKLCCQIATRDKDSRAARWIPKGKIAAGVEAYCIFPNGDEWGVQAKWFLTSPTAQQWSELDSSVKRALASHPRLKRYFVCMPTD